MHYHESMNIMIEEVRCSYNLLKQRYKYIYFKVDKTFLVNLIQSVIVGMHTQVPTIYVYTMGRRYIHIYMEHLVTWTIFHVRKSRFFIIKQAKLHI